MGDTQIQRLFDDTLEESSTNELPSFDIDLLPLADEGSTFQTRNEPSDPYQRGNIIQREGVLRVHCSFLDVVHGLFSAEGEAYATLLVLQFRFDIGNSAKRFATVDISLEFEGVIPGGDGPAVSAIAPAGRMNLVPTTHLEDTKPNASLQLEGNVQVGVVTETEKVEWKKSVSSDANDETTVKGSIVLRGRNWGKLNCARWSLVENKTAKTGVPTSMQMAVLLKRDNDDPFQCGVMFRARVFDFRNQVQEVVGRNGPESKGDPILFNPLLKETNNLRKYDTEELGAFELERVCM